MINRLYNVKDVVKRCLLFFYGTQWLSGYFCLVWFFCYSILAIKPSSSYKLREWFSTEIHSKPQGSIFEPLKNGYKESNPVFPQMHRCDSAFPPRAFGNQTLTPKGHSCGYQRGFLQIFGTFLEELPYTPFPAHIHPYAVTSFYFWCWEWYPGRWAC